MRSIPFLLLCSLALTVTSLPAHACDPWPKCAFDAQRARDQSEQIVEQAKDNSANKLLIFNKLNVLDVSDEIVGTADIRALVGSYAYFEGDKKTLQIIGANFEGKFDRIQLKDRRLFEGVVKRGFDTGLAIPVLKVGLKRNQVAELVIDDIAFASIEAKADQIACNFPIAYRERARSGQIRPVFIKSAAISRIRKRYFTRSKVSGSGTYLLVSANGQFHVSDDTTITHFVITPQVVPAMPASPADCAGKTAVRTTPRAGTDGVTIEINDTSKKSAVTVEELQERLEAQAGLTGKVSERGGVISIVR